MPAEILSFSFESSSSPSRVIEVNGEPWWVAKDVAEALEYAETSLETVGKLISHVPDVWKGRYPIPAPSPEEWKGSNPITTLGGVQEMLCLSEPGLFFFINRSDKPKALPFQKWLAGEVLPAIRKRGYYGLMTPVERMRHHVALSRLVKQAVHSHDGFEQHILMEQVKDACALLRITMPPLSTLGKPAPQLTLAEV